MGERVMPIPGYPSRQHLLDHLEALEREKRSTYSLAHLEAIKGQEALFRSELESLGEGDYPEPAPPKCEGRFSWIGPYGQLHTR